MPTYAVSPVPGNDVSFGWQNAHMLVIYDDGPTGLSSEASVLYILRLAFRDDHGGLFVVVWS
jgi:hypothetical protein